MQRRCGRRRELPDSRSRVRSSSLLSSYVRTAMARGGGALRRCGGGSRRASRWLLVGRDHGRGRRGGGALRRSRPGEGRRGGGAVRRSRPEQGRTVKELSGGCGLGSVGARPPAITSWGREARWRGSGNRGLRRAGALQTRRRRRSILRIWGSRRRAALF